MKQVIKQCKKSGLKKLEAEALETNKRAVKLYLKLGFEKEGLLRSRVKSEKVFVNVIVMGKIL